MEKTAHPTYAHCPIRHIVDRFGDKWSLLVLSNRGSRIVLGMVRGFYPGYDSELHEVYVYEKVK